MRFTNNDAIAAATIGAYVALLFLAILSNIRSIHPLVTIIAGHPLRWLLIVVVPVLAVALLYVTHRLTRKAGTKTWFQAGKFLTTGFGNLFVDLGLLNILIMLTGATGGILFAVIKGTSFVASVIHSYVWNKFWTFHKKETKHVGQEFLAFFIVAVIGLGLNVGSASFVVIVIPPLGGLGLEAWANVAAFIAAMVSFFWNFYGAKYLVFERTSSSTNNQQLTDTESNAV